MKKFVFVVLSVLSISAAQADAKRVLTCTPADDGDNSGLESVTVTETVTRCPDANGMPTCHSIQLRYSAEVTVNVPFDNFVSQSFNVSPERNDVIPGRGVVYVGKGFELDLGPVIARPVAHLHARVKAQDGYPTQVVDTAVICK